MNRPTQLLSSHARSRQEQAILRADSAVAAADRSILAVWHQLLTLLRDSNGDPFEAQARAGIIFRPLTNRVALTLRTQLRSLAWWSWKSARHGLQQAIPEKLLALAVADRLYKIPESKRALLEDEGEKPDILDILFPAPSESEIVHLMGTDWLEQLSHATRLAAPTTLADIVGGGMAAGKSQTEIARDLLPAVDGFRVSARRIARTEGLRIAHAAQMHVHEQLGDLLAGYTIHATLDSRTRPAHAARDGLTWRKDLGESMQVALKMEGPTLPDGYNCRCYLTPILI